MSDLERKYNLKSPAVKRLMREAAELSQPTEQYFAQPLEENLFEWHFTIRGPPQSDFAGGIYHGKITLPPEYPMKPPSIILLTPNGRFELGKKICLSMSAHHPETWQPSWSIRTVLLALIGFMPSQGGGALGSLDYTPEERKNLATRSMEWKCNSCQIDHTTCLIEVTPGKDTNMDEAKELAAQISFKGESERPKSTADTSGLSTNSEPTSVHPLSTVAPSLRHRSNVNSTSARAPHIPQRSILRSTADYFSLGLMWVITAVLLVLVLRRLAMEKRNLTGAD